MTLLARLDESREFFKDFYLSPRTQSPETVHTNRGIVTCGKRVSLSEVYEEANENIVSIQAFHARGADEPFCLFTGQLRRFYVIAAGARSSIPWYVNRGSTILDGKPTNKNP
jgi:hypothetical protein